MSTKSVFYCEKCRLYFSSTSDEEYICPSCGATTRYINDYHSAFSPVSKEDIQMHKSSDTFSFRSIVRFLICFLLFGFAYSLVIVTLKYFGIILGGLPTFFLSGLFIYLGKKYYDHLSEKASKR